MTAVLQEATKGPRPDDLHAWDKERRCCSAILLPQPLRHPPPKPAASRFAIAFRYWSDSFTARGDGIRAADVGSPLWLVVRPVSVEQARPNTREWSTLNPTRKASYRMRARAIRTFRARFDGRGATSGVSTARPGPEGTHEKGQRRACVLCAQPADDLTRCF